MAVTDVFARPLRTLRVSVTDRCNLRCEYCMPQREYVWIPHDDILRFEEIATLADVFVGLGVERVRLTGGEPLLRRDLPRLVQMLAARAGIRDLALTTNGVLLAEQAAALRAAGLHRLTVSLDTLQPERFAVLTQRRQLGRVLAGIEAARRAGFARLKLDTVVMRGFNDDEMFALLTYGQQLDAEVRFIEYMDVGGALRWTRERVVARAEMLRRLRERFGPIEPLGAEGSAPAERFRLSDGTVFGIIASTTAPFCHSCDRSRLTADGVWYSCLYAPRGTDLRAPLRDGIPAGELRDRIRRAWQRRADRGAEERLRLVARSALVDAGDLRQDPHLEMHTRGG